MRFPVFGRGANPRIDIPIQRKKMAYLEELVCLGNSDWVDRADHRKGIVAHEIIYFGKRLGRVFTSEHSSSETPGYDFEELPGVYFVSPDLAQNGAIKRWHWDLAKQQLGTLEALSV
jgi:hypothetical protein